MIDLRILTLLLAAGLINTTASAITPILPLLDQFFSKDPNAAHWIPDLVTFPGLFTIISALITGWAIDHWGRLGIFRFGLIVYAIGGSSGALCSSIAGLFIGRMLIGVALGTIMATNTSLIADYFSGEKRKKVLSWQACAIGIGSITALSLSGLLANISWRLAFLLYLFALVVLACSYFLYETQPYKINTSQSPSTPVPFLVKKILAIVLISGVFITAPFYTVYTQLSLYIAKSSHLSTTKMGLLLAVPTVALSAISLLYPHIKNRLRFAKIHALGFFLCGCGYLIVAYHPNPPYDIIGFAVIGTGFGLNVANFFNWINTITPEAYRGRANGALTTSAFSGQFLTPVLFDQFFDIFSFTTATIACTACLWVIAMLFFGLPDKYSQTHPTNS